MIELNVRLGLGALELDVQASLPLAGISALFGPSGSGKTTLLRVIAGLQDAQGHVRVGGEAWLDSAAGVNVPAHRRSVGYVFQDTRLFPHLNVAGNLEFAARRAPAGDIGFDAVVSALDLAALLPRAVSGLSGGERQRVALGRTLLTQPQLLLLDEPLSALDAARKAEILPYLQALPAQFSIPSIYVSHAVDEVALLADRTVVLSGGRVRASGPTPEILERLDLQPLTGLFEAGVVVSARVSGELAEFQLTELELGGQTLSMPHVAGVAVGDQVRLRIRARDVALATLRPAGLSIRNVLPATVVEVVTAQESALAEVLLDVGGERLRARVTRAAVHELGLSAGGQVFALIKSVTFDGHAP